MGEERKKVSRWIRELALEDIGRKMTVYIVKEVNEMSYTLVARHRME